MTTKNNTPRPATELSMLAGQALAGFGLLILVAVHMRIYATVFDHDFTLLAVGGALFGVAAGLALGHWLMAGEAGREELGCPTAAGLVVAGLTASGGLVLLLSWPLGGVLPFVVTVAAFAAPFAGWGYGVAGVARLPGASGVRGAWLAGALAGLPLAIVLVDYLDDPLAAGWWATIVLGLGALVVAGRRPSAGVGAGVLMVLGSAAYFLIGGFSLQPSWSEAGLATTRPIYGEMRSDKLAAAPETRWSGSHRSDVLTYRGQERELRWLFTDATVPVPVVVGGDHGVDWLKERFPLLAIPVLADKPQRLLTIGAFPGPELDLAQAAGVRQVQALAYNAGAAELLDLSLEGGVHHTDDPRGRASAEGEGFDQIVLPVTHINRGGRLGSNLQDRHLYTLEAFHDYWQRLRPGGLLVVTTADEALFVRTILTVWAMLERHPAEAGGPPALRSWGLRLAAGASFQGPYQYLFVVTKGNVAADLPGRLRQAMQGLPVEPLFGPGLAAGQRTLGNLFGGSQQPSQASQVEALFGKGFLASRHYAALFQLGGLARAEEILTRALSQQAGRWIFLSPATDQRPVFFDILPGQWPELKWLFTGTLFIVVGGVLFALPSLRRHDTARTQDQPAIAVYLAYFAMVGAAGAVALVGVLGQASRLVGVSLETQTALLATVLAGAAAALLPIRRPGSSRLPTALPPLVAMVLVALLYGVTGPGSNTIAGWPGPARWLLVAGCSVLTGVALVSLCSGALRHLTAFAPAVIAWAWLVLGAAALSGVVLAEWWAVAWGWGLVWPVLCGVYGVIVVAGFWLWRRPGRQDRPSNAKAATAV